MNLFNSKPYTPTLFYIAIPFSDVYTRTVILWQMHWFRFSFSLAIVQPVVLAKINLGKGIAQYRCTSSRVYKNKSCTEIFSTSTQLESYIMLTMFMFFDMIR